MSHLPVVGSALKVPLFHGLDPEQMSELIRRAERVAYYTGDTLIQNGDMGDAAILVITGRATQFNPFSTMHPYDPIEPGSLVGEMAMLVETTHHLTVVADTPVTALKFHRSMIETAMGEDPRLADHFVSRIATRLTDLAAEMRATLVSPTTVASEITEFEDIKNGPEPLREHNADTASDQAFQGLPSSGTTVEPSSFPVN